MRASTLLAVACLLSGGITWKGFVSDVQSESQTFKRRAEQPTSNPPPVLRGLMRAIHEGFMAHRNETWLKDYSQSCFSPSPVPMIFSLVPENNPEVPGKPVTQQPNQLGLSLIGIHQTKGFKYFSDFDQYDVCKFPRYGLKLYGSIVDRNPDGMEARQSFINIVLKECRRTQRALKGRRSGGRTGIQTRSAG